MTEKTSVVSFYRAEKKPDVADTSSLQAQLEAVTKERDELKKGALPADALKRLEAVKGIGPDLAKAALDALTGK